MLLLYIMVLEKRGVVSVLRKKTFLQGTKRWGMQVDCGRSAIIWVQFRSKKIFSHIIVVIRRWFIIYMSTLHFPTLHSRNFYNQTFTSFRITSYLEFFLSQHVPQSLNTPNFGGVNFCTCYRTRRQLCTFQGMEIYGPKPCHALPF